MYVGTNTWSNLEGVKADTKVFSHLTWYVLLSHGFMCTGIVYWWYGDCDYYRATGWRNQAYISNNYIRKKAGHDLCCKKILLKSRMIRAVYLVRMNDGRLPKGVETM